MSREARQALTGLWLGRAGSEPIEFATRDEGRSAVRTRRRTARAVAWALALAALAAGVVASLRRHRAAAATLAGAVLLAVQGGGCEEKSPPHDEALDALDAIPYAGAAPRPPAPGTVQAREDGVSGVRRRFPETLLWEPRLLVAEGSARMDFELADSLTTWRVDGWALDAMGRAGAWAASFAVGADLHVEFEPPSVLTRGDEVELSMTVFNFTGAPLEAIVDASGRPFDWQDGQRRTIVAEPGANRVTFRAVARRLGEQTVFVRVQAGDRQDVVERVVTVEGEGHPVEVVTVFPVEGRATRELEIPDEAVPGTVRVMARVWSDPQELLDDSIEAVRAQGADSGEAAGAILRASARCLRDRGGILEARRERITSGARLALQRTLAFRNSDGGFASNPGGASDPVATAFAVGGLTEFARVLGGVDGSVVAGARQWLALSRRSDGSWGDPETTARVVEGLGDPGMERPGGRSRDWSAGNHAVTAGAWSLRSRRGGESSPRSLAVAIEYLSWLIRDSEYVPRWTEVTFLAGEGSPAAGRVLGRATLRPGRDDVVRAIDLTAGATAGRFAVEVRAGEGTPVLLAIETSYRLSEAPPSPFDVTVEYPVEAIDRGGRVRARLRVQNRSGQESEVLTLRVPLPPGFEREGADDSRAVDFAIGRLADGAAGEFGCDLVAVVPGRFMAPSAVLYADGAPVASSTPVALVVR